jgi:hypothetical protein
MPSKQQNREYLRDVVIPHVREVAKRQELMMLKTLGTSYIDPSELVDNLDPEDMKPAILNFGIYDKVYAKNCNIINDNYDCGREGCLAGWYLMMSEQQRRFVPWDPQWTSIKEFGTHALAKHFNISFSESHDLFGSTGEGVEQECLQDAEYEYNSHGYEKCIEEIAVAELTQGEILEMRVDVLKGVMA